MAEFVLLFSLMFICYTYFGYLLFLVVLSLFCRRTVFKKAHDTPPAVTIVIAARNEEEVIERRLQNLVDQDYPSAFLEIVVVSDGSDDKTVKRINSFLEKNVERASSIIVIEGSTALGKPSALNIGVECANGEIIVFADSRQVFDHEAVSELVSNFTDPRVGCVSGELLFYEDESSEIEKEMGAYWTYEKIIRKLESKTGSVVGATGAIYAIRRNLYRALSKQTILDDVQTPLNIASQGYRVIFEPKAKAYDFVSTHTQHEWRRKVRTLTGNWQLLPQNPTLLIPFAHPLWLRFCSHKFFRLIIPFFMLTTLLSSALCPTWYGKTLLVSQLVFYALATVASVWPELRKQRMVGLIYFFCVLNLAAAVGFLRWVTGRAVINWK